MKTDKVKITLAKGVSRYVLVKLVGAARVNIPTGQGLKLKYLRVGDFVEYPEADALCLQRSYEVTVTQ